MLEINTFSIAARCARTGMFGVAVSTAVPGVGGICPFVKAGVGAVSTQSWVNPIWASTASSCSPMVPAPRRRSNG
jgi:uncharacterized Ntn-hydrolase superfamily protein